MKHYQSFSSEETKRLGEELAQALIKKRAAKNNGALVLALQGDLGAGKTTFVQGFFKGLRLKKRAPSPTFVIMRRHKLKNKKFANVFHIDAYRLKKSANLAAIGIKDVFANDKNIVLVEWPEKIKNIMPKNSLWLKFKHGKKENERNLIFLGTAI